MANTSIEWTSGDDGSPGKVWNPVTGCSKVSAGCKNCYAERIAHRFWGERTFDNIRCHPERLDQPLRWRKPQRIFVDSMGDLFHEAVPFEFIAAVFGVMAFAMEHTFQVLTKRPGRMRDFMAWIEREDSVRVKEPDADPSVVPIVQRCLLAASHHAVGKSMGPMFGVHFCSQIKPQEGAPLDRDWPLQNVELGVSIEDQKSEDERVPYLLETPAAVRIVSAEPLLGPIEFRNPPTAFASHLDAIDWVIVGGESGPGARPCNVEWIRSIVSQCKAAGVPVFVKQLGAKPAGWCVNRLIPGSIPAEDGFCDSYESGEGGDCGDRCFMLKHPKGADPSEWPADLRMRQLPGD